MLIGDKYKIESDPLNVTLYKKEKARKPGSDNWQAIGYFATVKNALEHMANLDVNSTGLKDFETVVKKQNEIVTLIRSLKLPENSYNQAEGL